MYGDPSAHGARLAAAARSRGGASGVRWIARSSRGNDNGPHAGLLDCPVKPGNDNGPQAGPLDCPVKPGNDNGAGRGCWIARSSRAMTMVAAQ
jgi:hypothetical protein